MTPLAEPQLMTIQGRLEFHATGPDALRAGLCAALRALDAGVEPNLLWADGYRIAIMIGQAA